MTQMYKNTFYLERQQIFFFKKRGKLDFVGLNED